MNLRRHSSIFAELSEVNTANFSYFISTWRLRKKWLYRNFCKISGNDLLSDLDTAHESDRQTDRQTTDGQKDEERKMSRHNAALCMQSHAVKMKILVLGYTHEFRLEYVAYEQNIWYTVKKKNVPRMKL